MVYGTVTVTSHARAIDETSNTIANVQFAYDFDKTCLDAVFITIASV